MLRKLLQPSKKVYFFSIHNDRTQLIEIAATNAKFELDANCDMQTNIVEVNRDETVYTLTYRFHREFQLFFYYLGALDTLQNLYKPLKHEAI